MWVTERLDSDVCTMCADTLVSFGWCYFRIILNTIVSVQTLWKCNTESPKIAEDAYRWCTHKMSNQTTKLNVNIYSHFIL